MEEKKRRYSPAQNLATQKYQKENLEQVRFWVKKGKKKYYQDIAKAAGVSLTQFFTDAADEKIEREEK